MRNHRRLLANAGRATAGAGLLLTLAVPLLAGPAAAAPAPGACDPSRVVTAFHFTVNGKTVNSLHGHVQQGDHVEAFFTIASGCNHVPVALVAHTAPDAFFVRAHASQQRVYDGVKQSFNAGAHSMGPVTVPPCNFQVDFAALATKIAPGYTYSSATGGTTACGSGGGGTTTTTSPPTTTPPTTTPPTTVVRTSVSPSSTSVANVLAERNTGTLPLTGSNTGPLIAVAAGLLIAGGALTGLARRSGRTAS